MRSWFFAALSLLWLACTPARGSIGAVLAQSPEGELRLHHVERGLAADRAGLSQNDRILLIDGEDVRGLSEAELHRRLSGEVGEEVRLTVLRGREVLRVTLRRTPLPRAPAE